MPMTEQQAKMLEGFAQFLASVIQQRIEPMVKGASDGPVIVQDEDEAGNPVPKQTSMAQLIFDLHGALADNADLLERALILEHGRDSVECEIDELREHKKRRARR